MRPFSFMLYLVALAFISFFQWSSWLKAGDDQYFGVMLAIAVICSLIAIADSVNMPSFGGSRHVSLYTDIAPNWHGMGIISLALLLSTTSWGIAMAPYAYSPWLVPGAFMLFVPANLLASFHMDMSEMESRETKPPYKAHFDWSFLSSLAIRTICIIWAVFVNSYYDPTTTAILVFLLPIPIDLVHFSESYCQALTFYYRSMLPSSRHNELVPLLPKTRHPNSHLVAKQRLPELVV